MKKNIFIYTLIILLVVTSVPACRKSIAPTDPLTNGDTTVPISIVPFPTTSLSQCSGAPNYGDSILYLQPSTSDYIVSPLNHPDTGKYFSWPIGMEINQNTGSINITKSETGLRYKVGYVKNGTTDTCLQTIILGGASYPDSIFVLSDGEQFARPYFNADPNLISVCNGGTVTNGINCMFDVTGQATSQHIAIDLNTGVIDLKKTLNQGAFGLLPLNGTSIQTTITYKLNDNSSMAMQHIPVTFIYYNRKADVPPDLLAAVEDKLNKILQNVLLINILGSSNTTVDGNPRPPIIIITRSN